MRLRFDIKDYGKVYDTLVGVLGFERGCFLTDDCIEIDEENFDTYTIPEFPPKGVESHYLVIDPSYADSFFLDSRAMLDVTGECTVGNITVCKWKILKKRINNQLYNQ